VAVFPYLGNYGHGYDDHAQGVLRVYPDLSYRFYKKSNGLRTEMPLVFSRYDQTRVNAIRAFFSTNKFAPFFVYDPGVVSAVDGSGASSTGRHTAIFAADDGSAPVLSVRNLGRCIYDVEIRFIFLD
jgi:hypothetical protein